MQTVILAAGEGTRMRPLTTGRPKPVLPVADSSLIEHIGRAAVDAGATKIVVVIGYEGAAVRDALGTSLADVPITYVEQPTQAGTGDAVRVARSSLDTETFAVLNGDLLLDREDLSALFTAGPGVGTTTVDEPQHYGVIDPRSDGTIRQIVEKPDDPPSLLVNAGAYVFPSEAIDAVDNLERSARDEYELTDLVNLVCAEHSMTAVTFDRWLDVGRPWELLEANEWKLAELEPNISGTVHTDATIDGQVVISPGAKVKSGVTIEGPVFVGPGAVIGPNAYVRGATMIGADARVGHAVEIKNSVLFPGATVGHQSYVGDSLLGDDVNLGAGTNVANLRHDGDPVTTWVKGERTSTGRRKFGAVLGPEVKTGINSSLNAGLVLDAKAMTMPGEVRFSPEK